MLYCFVEPDWMNWRLNFKLGVGIVDATQARPTETLRNEA